MDIRLEGFRIEIVDLLWMVLKPVSEQLTRFVLKNIHYYRERDHAKRRRRLARFREDENQDENENEDDEEDAEEEEEEEEWLFRRLTDLTIGLNQRDVDEEEEKLEEELIVPASFPNLTSLRMTTPVHNPENLAKFLSQGCPSMRELDLPILGEMKCDVIQAVVEGQIETIEPLII
ncbi:hypothetical protein BGX28_004187 [Mortierella sp. GBA30]|nr:hypothetical protein BGX28_004187 [Mortierella sp. GBA30]